MSSSSELNKRTHFKIGSRKSKLAMVQTESIRDDLKLLNPEFTFEIINFDTIGDKILDKALAKIGDKGLFTKELEDALALETIDFVVHSLKDVPCQSLPPNLCICGITKRENPNDAVVMSKRWSHLQSLEQLPANSVIGTSSLRRIAQLTSKYPQLQFQSIRGNLNTRFRKLDEENQFDAIILAMAGLKRLNFSDRVTYELDSLTCMHAVGQGALGIECRLDDEECIKMLNKLNDEETVLRCIAERTFLASLEGGCSAPIGVNTFYTSNKLRIDGIVLSLDGKEELKESFEVDFVNNLEETKCCPINFSNENFNINEQDASTFKQSYTFIVDLKINRQKLNKAEFCGKHLGSMLIARGADRLIHEAKMQIKKD